MTTEPGNRDPENIETMHAFIDMMDFTNMKFTDAMRNLLQAFRLPGEAQKIDRFMLKFAERYFQGNTGVLANAGMSCRCITSTFNAEHSN